MPGATAWNRRRRNGQATPLRPEATPTQRTGDVATAGNAVGAGETPNRGGQKLTRALLAGTIASVSSSALSGLYQPLHSAYPA